MKSFNSFFSKKVLLIFISVCFIFSFKMVLPIVVGSDSAVSKESFVTFPSADNDNEILGFAWMSDGFTLEDSATSCTFNCLFPVSGDVSLNGGNFYLNQDFSFKNPADLKSVGNIYGYNYGMYFCDSIKELSFEGITGGSKSFNLIAKENLEDSVTSVAWSYDNKYFVATTLKQDGNELRLFYFDNDVMTLTASAEIADNVNSVDFHSSEYYITIGEKKGLRVFYWNISNGSLSQTDGISGDDTYSVRWTNTGEYLAVGSAASGEELIIYPFSDGILDEANKISANIMPGVPIGLDSGLDWDWTGSYLAVGSDTGEHELMIYYFDGASLTLTASVDVNIKINSVSWSPFNSFLAVGLNGPTESLRLYKYNISTGIILREYSGNIGETKDIYSLDFNYDSNYLLMGLAADGGTEFRVYNFSSGSMTFTLMSGLGFSANINAVRWSWDGQYMGRGDQLNYASIYNFLSAIVFDNVRLIFDAPITLKVPIVINGNCYINTRGNTFFVDENSYFYIKAGSSLYFENSLITSEEELPIRCSDRNSYAYFVDTSILLAANIYFDNGCMDIDGVCDINGSYSFFFDSAQSLSIHDHSALNIKNGVYMSFGASNTYEQQPLYFATNNSELNFVDGTLKITNSGLKLTKGRLVCDGNMVLDIDSTSTCYGLKLGNNNSDDDIDLILKSKSVLDLKNGCLANNLSGKDKIRGSDDSNFIRRSNSTLYLNNDTDFSNIAFKIEDGAVLETADDVVINYKKCEISIPEVTYKTTSIVYDTNTLLFNSNGDLFIYDGILPLNLIVRNSENTLNGDGSISGEITLSDSGSKLYINLDGEILNNINLNYGSIILNSNLEIGRDSIISGQGSFNIGNYDLKLGSKDLIWTSTIYWDIDAGNLEFNSMIELSTTWTFSGDCTIKGNKNILWLNPTGKIVVERGSSLKLQDLRIQSLKEENIKCEDNSGQIIFSNCKAILDGDYDFATGSFYVDYKFDIQGSYVFYYKSSQISYIGPFSIFTFFQDTTFSYSPASTQRNLIHIDSQDSILCLNQATLHSTTTGIQLTKGILRLEGPCYFSSDATCNAEAIMFGDGQNSENDLLLDPDRQSTLELLSGYLFINNVNG